MDIARKINPSPPVRYQSLKSLNTLPVRTPVSFGDSFRFQPITYEVKKGFESVFTNLKAINQGEYFDLCQTLSSLKPSALLTFQAKDKEFLLKNKHLLESGDFKLVISNVTKDLGKQGSVVNAYMFNLDVLKPIITEHRAYIAHRLGNDAMTEPQILEKIMKPDSPLFNMSAFNDLTGLILGYPLEDVMMFQVQHEADQMIEYLKAKTNHTTPQERLLSLVSNVIRSDRLTRFTDEKSKAVGNMLKSFGLSSPIRATQDTVLAKKGCFLTWNPSNPSVKRSLDAIKRGLSSQNSIYTNPEAIVDYLQFHQCVANRR